MSTEETCYAQVEIKTFKIKSAPFNVTGVSKKNETVGACNMYGKIRTAYEVNLENLQGRDQLVDPALDDTKKIIKTFRCPIIENFSIVLFDTLRFI